MAYSPEQVQEIASDKRIARNKPFVNALFGQNMNQDAAFGGTPIQVHDGIDSVLWTGSQIVGSSVTFNSTERPYAGSNSVKVDNPDVGDIWQFTAGSSEDLTGHSAITIRINIDKDWTPADSIAIYGWDTGLSAMVGVVVNIEDYMSEGDFDVWQHIVIPLSTLSLEDESIDAIRMELLSKDVKAPVFYMDDIQIEETGGITFEVAPDVNKDFYISNVRLSIVNNVVGTAAKEHDDLLGLTLLNGITINRTSDGVERVGRNLQTLYDLYSVGFDKILLEEGATDSILTVEIKFDIPVILRSATGDTIALGINDNLSGYIQMSAIARGETNA